MDITRNNVEQVVDILVNGYVNSNYNDECFGANDILRHLTCAEAVQILINTLRDHGYDPYVLAKPTLDRYGCNYIPVKQDTLKGEIENGVCIPYPDNFFEACRYNYYPYVDEFRHQQADELSDEEKEELDAMIAEIFPDPLHS